MIGKIFFYDNTPQGSGKKSVSKEFHNEGKENQSSLDDDGYGSVKISQNISFQMLLLKEVKKISL